MCDLPVQVELSFLAEFLFFSGIIFPILGVKCSFSVNYLPFTKFNVGNIV